MGLKLIMDLIVKKKVKFLQLPGAKFRIISFSARLGGSAEASGARGLAGSGA